MRNSNVLLKVCILTFTFSVMLTGCGKTDAEKYDADKNTLFVASDSSVVSTIIDTLDEEYYDASELEEFTKGEIEGYNNEILEDAISLISFTSENDKVKLIMKYLSAKHYFTFNQEELYIATVATAMDDGYMFETGFVDYKNLEDVELTDAVYDTSVNVLIMEPTEDTVISLPGKVTFISSHATQMDKKTVQIPANCRSYIIYE